MPKSQDKALVKLKEIDSGLDTAHHNLDAIAEKERFDEVTAKLGQIRDELKVILEEIQKLEAEEKRREDEDEKVEIKIVAEERKMFSGKISNPKELISIQQELDSLRKKKDDLDTKCLIAMEELDDKKTAQTTLATEEGDLRREAESLERAYRQIEKKLNDEISAFSLDRKKIRQVIEDDLYEEYKHLRQREVDPPVVYEEGGVCGGCHMEISDQSAQIEGTTLRKCEHCHRILVTI